VSRSSLTTVHFGDDAVADRVPVAGPDGHLGLRPGPQAEVPAHGRPAHPVELLGPAPLGLLDRGPVEPQHPAALVPDEPEQGRVGGVAEALGGRHVVVPALVHDQDDVEAVEQLVADAAELLQDAHPEPAGRLEQRGQQRRVEPEAAELVVVLDADPTGRQEDVDLVVAHASAAMALMRCTDCSDGTVGKYSSPIGPA
jgi:hypothetical protein